MKGSDTLRNSLAARLALIFGLISLLVVAASATADVRPPAVAGSFYTGDAEALRQDVERLRESRSAAVELEASELRRIERDLHDGAQQRLVALKTKIGLASTMAQNQAIDDVQEILAEVGEERVAPGVTFEAG